VNTTSEEALRDPSSADLVTATTFWTIAWCGKQKLKISWKDLVSKKKYQISRRDLEFI
jgi:hypothetical protein